MNSSNLQFLHTATAEGNNLRTEGSWRPERGTWFGLFLIWPRDVSTATPHGQAGKPERRWALLPPLLFHHGRDAAQEIQKEGRYFITC